MNPSLIQQQIAVVAGLRRAFEKFRHHAQFTRRVKPLIVAELPGYTVSVDPDHYGLRTVRVRDFATNRAASEIAISVALDLLRDIAQAVPRTP